jgi:uncharacterized membrane protein SpoIIM required for sporulation
MNLVNLPNKKLLTISIFFWTVSSFTGFLASINTQKDILNSVSGIEKRNYSTLLGEPQNPLVYILKNLKLNIILLLGAFSLGLMTFINLAFNGMFFGIFIGLLIKSGVPINNLILSIIPHGIFELPSLWLAGAAGLKGPQVFLRYLKGGIFVTEKDVKEFLILGLLSIILLIAAGFMESKITFKIVEGGLP